VSRGAVSDAVELVQGIGRLLKNLKQKSGVAIKSLDATLSGEDIIIKQSKAVIPLAERGNKVITHADVNRVCEQARILASSLEEEIIYDIPLSFGIDGRNSLVNPLGLYSHRLEVQEYLICCRVSALQSLDRIIHQAGYELKDVFFSGLATAKALGANAPQEGVSVVCDVGGETTTLIVLKDGYMCDIQIFCRGGNNLTNRLCDALRLPYALAEEVKRSYGTITDDSSITEDKEILIKKDEVYKLIKQRMVSEVITEEARLLCQTIKAALVKKVEPYRITHFTAVGRTMLQEGFLELLENTVGVPVKLGRVTHPDIVPFVTANASLPPGDSQLNYLTAFGIVAANMHPEVSRILSQELKSRNPFQRGIYRLKEIYQEYF
jgi:cell division protein FtsA